MSDIPFRPLRGVLVPLVTPLSSPDQLDEEAADKLIEHIVNGGVDGLFLLGTTGEAPQLSFEVRKALIHRACKAVNGRIRVLAGISDTSADDAIKLAHIAAEAGAEGVFFTPPFYFMLSQDEVLRYCEWIATRLPVPFMLYNMPSHARNEFSIDTVVKISQFPGAVGIKDSSANWDYFSKLVDAFRDRPDYPVFTGPEEVLIDALRIGAAGGVAGGGNVAPHWVAGIARAFERGDQAEADFLQNKLREFGGGIYGVAGGSSSYIRGLKCALAHLDLCSGVLSAPFEPLNGGSSKAIRDFLIRAELL